MTPTQIRAQYVQTVGEEATVLLEQAGLLPIAQEMQWRRDDDQRQTTNTRDVVPYVRQSRYVTRWADLPA